MNEFLLIIIAYYFVTLIKKHLIYKQTMNALTLQLHASFMARGYAHASSTTCLCMIPADLSMTVISVTAVAGVSSMDGMAARSRDTSAISSALCRAASSRLTTFVAGTADICTTGVTRASAAATHQLFRKCSFELGQVRV